MIFLKLWFAYKKAKPIEHYEKSLDLGEDAGPRRAEVEDARERLAKLTANQ